MIVICSKCGWKYESVIIDRALALNEIESKSMRHCQQKHSEEFALVAQGLQKLQMAMARHIHFGEFMIVPEQEDYVLDQLREGEELLMLALDVDFEEDETEDEEENQDEVETEEIEVPEHPGNGETDKSLTEVVASQDTANTVNVTSEK